MRCFVIVRRGAVLASLALGVVACGGVSPQSQPQEIERATVPFELLDQQRGLLPATSLPEIEAFVVYLVGESGLVEAERAEPRSPSLRAVLRALLEGPTEAEAEIGLRSLIPPDLDIRTVVVEGEVATIDLGGTFEEALSSEDRTLGLAQIVYTMTQRAPVERVRFEIEGRPVEVPRADGSLTRNPVDRDDYPQ